jgi:hypothetical protein
MKLVYGINTTHTPHAHLGVVHLGVVKKNTGRRADRTHTSVCTNFKAYWQSLRVLVLARVLFGYTS